MRVHHPIAGCAVGFGVTPGEVNADLQRAGMDPQTATAATNAWAAMPTSTVSSIVNIAQGNSSPSSVIPLVAAGLAASGVGAPAVAVVVSGVAILEGVASALFGSGQQDCRWTVGGNCFKGPRPSGPQDPAWRTFASFDDSGGDIDKCRSITGLDHPVAAFGAGFMCTTFPLYSIIMCDEDALATESPQAIADYFGIDVSQVDAIKSFYALYYAMWRKNAEYAINGFAYADEGGLLEALRTAWNQVFGGSSTITIQPKGGDSSRCFGGTFIELVVGGAIGGQRHVPFVINTAPGGLVLHLPPGGIHLPPPNSGSSTTASKVGGGVALTAGAAILTAAVLYAKGKTITWALDKVWEGVKHLWKRV